MYKSLEQALLDLEKAVEIDEDGLMDEIFERAKIRGGFLGSILDEMILNDDIPRKELGGEKKK